MGIYEDIANILMFVSIFIIKIKLVKRVMKLVNDMCQLCHAAVEENNNIVRIDDAIYSCFD